LPVLENLPKRCLINPETWLPYQLAKPSDVSIHIYNASGITLVSFHPSKSLVGVGQEPISVTAKVERGPPPVGGYERLIKIIPTGIDYPSGTSGEPVDLTVRVEIGDEPILVVELPQPDKKIRLCPGEENEINVGNAGKGVLVWKITGVADWLKVTPREGKVEEGEKPDLVKLESSLEIGALTENDSLDLQVSGGSKANPDSQA